MCCLIKYVSGTIYEHILCTNYGGARGVMVIVVGNGHGDTSSNPGQALILLGKYVGI